MDRIFGVFEFISRLVIVRPTRPAPRRPAAANNNAPEAAAPGNNDAHPHED